MTFRTQTEQSHHCVLSSTCALPALLSQKSLIKKVLKPWVQMENEHQFIFFYVGYMWGSTTAPKSESRSSWLLSKWANCVSYLSNNIITTLSSVLIWMLVIDQLNHQPINWDHVWHFEIICISPRLCSQGRWKKKKKNVCRHICKHPCQSWLMIWNDAAKRDSSETRWLA